jgi:hypothetical protein
LECSHIVEQGILQEVIVGDVSVRECQPSLVGPSEIEMIVRLPRLEGVRREIVFAEHVVVRPAVKHDHLGSEVALARKVQCDDALLPPEVLNP